MIEFRSYYGLCPSNNEIRAIDELTVTRIVNYLNLIKLRIFLMDFLVHFVFEKLIKVVLSNKALYAIKLFCHYTGFSNNLEIIYNRAHLNSYKILLEFVVVVD